jgi:hypothetical protein
MKAMLAVVALLVLGLTAVPTKAQNVYQMSQNCGDVILYPALAGVHPAYSNVFCDDMPMTLDSGSYYISVNFHSQGSFADGQDQTIDPTVETANIQFWNLGTGQVVNYPITGTFDWNNPVYYKVTSAVLNVTFPDGSLVLTFAAHTPPPPCGRGGCRTSWTVAGALTTTY